MNGTDFEPKEYDQYGWEYFDSKGRLISEYSGQSYSNLGNVLKKGFKARLSTDIWMADRNLWVGHPNFFLDWVDGEFIPFRPVNRFWAIGGNQGGRVNIGNFRVLNIDKPPNALTGVGVYYDNAPFDHPFGHFANTWPPY